MTDQQFPGFEGDDEQAKAKKPATGAIAKQSAAQPPLKPAAAPSYEFEDSPAPAPKAKKSYAPDPTAAPPSDARNATEKTPATMHPVLDDPGQAKPKAPRPAAPPPPVDDPIDPDLKPGSRKDLWTCPHCGTGNKPGRPTCRKCDKSPDDEVETPWFKKPAAIGGIVAGVVLLIVVIAMLGGTDLTMKPPEAGAIDGKVRVGGSATGTKDVDGHAFTAHKRLSVCGRCLGSATFAPAPGGWTVVLLLGKKARAEDAGGDATVNFNNERTDVTASGPYCVLHLIPSSGTIAKPDKGKIISLQGQDGELEGSLGGYDEHTVLVEGYAQGE